MSSAPKREKRAIPPPPSMDVEVNPMAIESYNDATSRAALPVKYSNLSVKERRVIKDIDLDLDIPFDHITELCVQAREGLVDEERKIAEMSLMDTKEELDYLVEINQQLTQETNVKMYNLQLLAVVNTWYKAKYEALFGAHEDLNIWYNLVTSFYVYSDERDKMDHTIDIANESGPKGSSTCPIFTLSKDKFDPTLIYSGKKREPKPEVVKKAEPILDHEFFETKLYKKYPKLFQIGVFVANAAPIYLWPLYMDLKSLKVSDAKNYNKGKEASTDENETHKTLKFQFTKSIVANYLRSEIGKQYYRNIMNMDSLAKVFSEGLSMKLDQNPYPMGGLQNLEYFNIMKQEGVLKEGLTVSGVQLFALVTNGAVYRTAADEIKLKSYCRRCYILDPITIPETKQISFN